MEQIYPYVQIVHLICAIIFLGYIFFDVVIFSRLKSALGADFERVKKAIGSRAIKIMPVCLFTLIITGGMTYTFMKALGGKIGKSICEDDKLDLALELLAKAKEKGVNLVLAEDSKIADDFSNDAKTAYAASNEIPDGWEGMDIGPETEKRYAEVIRASKTILWNGPTGVFEFENFTHGSRSVAEAIVEATKNGAYSLIGGGDSVACINKFGLADGVSYVSTGGGALLEAIEGKTLPGIEAIRGY